MAWRFTGEKAVFIVPAEAKADELIAALRLLVRNNAKARERRPIEDRLQGLENFSAALVAAIKAPSPIPPLRAVPGRKPTTHVLEVDGYAGEFAVDGETVECLQFRLPR